MEMQAAVAAQESDQEDLLLTYSLWDPQVVLRKCKRRRRLVARKRREELLPSSSEASSGEEEERPVYVRRRRAGREEARLEAERTRLTGELERCRRKLTAALRKRCTAAPSSVPASHRNLTATPLSIAMTPMVGKPRMFARPGFRGPPRKAPGTPDLTVKAAKRTYASKRGGGPGQQPRNIPPTPQQHPQLCVTDNLVQGNNVPYRRVSLDPRLPEPYHIASASLPQFFVPPPQQGFYTQQMYQQAMMNGAHLHQGNRARMQMGQFLGGAPNVYPYSLQNLQGYQGLKQVPRRVMVPISGTTIPHSHGMVSANQGMVSANQAIISANQGMIYTNQGMMQTNQGMISGSQSRGLHQSSQGMISGSQSQGLHPSSQGMMLSQRMAVASPQTLMAHYQSSQMHPNPGRMVPGGIGSVQGMVPSPAVHPSQFHQNYPHPMSLPVSTNQGMPTFGGNINQHRLPQASPLDPSKLLQMLPQKHPNEVLPNNGNNVRGPSQIASALPPDLIMDAFSFETPSP